MHPAEYSVDSAYRRSLDHLDEDEPFNWEDTDIPRDMKKDDQQ